MDVMDVVGPPGLLGLALVAMVSRLVSQAHDARLTVDARSVGGRLVYREPREHGDREQEHAADQ